MKLLGRRAFLAVVASAVWVRRLRAEVVTLDEFMELSERLLGRRNLDRQAGERFLDALNSDPDSAVTLANLVQSNGNPTPEQRLLSAIIIQWWSTGIYAADGKRRVATHAGALSWTSLGPLSPWFRGW